MKYIIHAGCDLFGALQGLSERMIAANNAAKKLADKYGATEYYPESRLNYIAGGITGFVLNEKPAAWRLAFGGKERRAFYPREINANRVILDELQALPKVEVSELNDILRYERQIIGPAPNHGQRYELNPAVYFRDKYILVSMHENANYEPVFGMEEVTVSEFKRLLGNEKEE